ncbi:sugar ABC transporter permease [Paenibacillus sp. IB182496]|uniref:Sugar ABC transporter permease n=1 Tax=Paenibacillus sabuli TaxID=2772509 RepID=A0A927GTN1_9BACL|nr:ABC transporter permease subunit [Paenibacillus sabuli]MBD2847773.1 sugar ABC transporter permease [Paenibacillus sabuli]
MEKAAAHAQPGRRGKPVKRYAARRSGWLHHLIRDRYLYLFLVPALSYFFLFKFVTLYGELIAFKDFRLLQGVWGSTWVGLKHFRILLDSPDFWLVLRNTLLLNVYNLAVAFPAPILLAVLLSEVRLHMFKRVVQNMLYLPYFISWVVLGGIIVSLLSPSTGVVNHLLGLLGIEPIYFMTDSGWWPVVFSLSTVWQGAGWGTIIYMAAIAAIDPGLYEAARMDGASKLRQIWHITLPGIRGTIAILLVLQMGKMMDVGFEHVFNLQNPAVFSVSDVISTYVYRTGLQNAQYSLATAVGLFQGVIGLVLVLLVNKIVKKLGEGGLW